MIYAQKLIKFNFFNVQVLFSLFTHSNRYHVGAAIVRTRHGAWYSESPRSPSLYRDIHRPVLSERPFCEEFITRGNIHRHIPNAPLVFFTFSV